MNKFGKTLKALEDFYGFRLWTKGSPFRVLISTILSQRTKDANTDKATDALFSKFDTPEKISKASISQIEKLIRPSGFYKTKAVYVKTAANYVVKKGMPKTLEEMVSIRGVGRKTANCVLVYGYGIPAIPVDTHVHRISNLLGWVKTKTPDETEKELEKILPKKYWIELNQMLVMHGQKTCLPRSPKCEKCPLTWCPSRKMKVKT